jgi:hypothetical protein
MKHDISKLHPIHQKTYREFVESTFTPNEVPDELYNLWLDLNETVPDIIGKQEKDMTKDQKKRFKDKVKETESKRDITVVE